MPGLGALYSRASTYVFGDWNKCGELMGLAPYGRPDKAKPLLQFRDGNLVIPDWAEDLDRAVAAGVRRKLGNESVDAALARLGLVRAE